MTLKNVRSLWLILSWELKGFDSTCGGEGACEGESLCSCRGEEEGECEGDCEGEGRWESERKRGCNSESASVNVNV